MSFLRACMDCQSVIKDVTLCIVKVKPFFILAIRNGRYTLEKRSRDNQELSQLHGSSTPMTEVLSIKCEETPTPTPAPAYPTPSAQVEVQHDAQTWNEPELQSLLATLSTDDILQSLISQSDYPNLTRTLDLQSGGGENPSEMQYVEPLEAVTQIPHSSPGYPSQSSPSYTEQASPAYQPQASPQYSGHISPQHQSGPVSPQYSGHVSPQHQSGPVSPHYTQQPSPQHVSQPSPQYNNQEQCSSNYNNQTSPYYNAPSPHYQTQPSPHCQTQPSPHCQTQPSPSYSNQPSPVYQEPMQPSPIHLPDQSASCLHDTCMTTLHDIQPIPSIDVFSSQHATPPPALDNSLTFTNTEDELEEIIQLLTSVEKPEGFLSGAPGRQDMINKENEFIVSSEINLLTYLYL